LSRTWTFQYTSNRLSSVTFPAVGQPPQNYMVSFGYDGSNRISTLTDRDGDAYSYVFVSGKITRVVDPAPYNTQQQRFSYVDLGGGQTRTDYTDRRNLVWKYTFNSLNEWTVYQAPDLTQKQFGYDALHNPNSYTNELGKVWSATYDNRGNLLTTTDPLLHQTVRTWSNAPLNNMLTFRDADLNVWQFEYADAVNPIALTKMTEPGDGYGNPAAVTTISWYQTLNGRGLPKEVLDANATASDYQYDIYGQLSNLHEGDPNPGEGPGSGYNQGCVQDAGSRVIGVSGGLSGHSATWDNLDRIEGFSCAVEESGPNPPGSYLPPLPNCTGALPVVHAAHSWTWTPMSQMLTSNNATTSPAHATTNTYDQLGRLRTASMSGDFGAAARQFTYTPNWVTGVFERNGPDGVLTTVATDTKYRLQTLTRGDGMNATYTWFNNDLPQTITYANAGTSTEYVFDDAERVTTIRHRRNPGNEIFLQLVYTYTARDLIETVTETDENSQVSTVTFTYDVRSRLRREVRIGQSPYDLTYTHDQLGNRLTKVDALANRTTTYTYDVSDPLFYGSKNNRLVKFTISQTGGPLLETVWYAYDANGNVTRKIRNPAGTNSYTAALLVYNSSKQVEYVIGEQWSGSGDCQTLYSRTYAWRFRYDGARQRYMRQQLDLTTLAPISTEWSDYDANSIYDDFTVSGETAAVTRAYESGTAEKPAGGDALYWQGDLLGSNRTLAAPPASAPPIVRRRVFTAFGEIVSTSGTSDSRYRYAGAWGYQSHDDIPLQHVGFRYYDAETGRFLQRDPVGMTGGLNVYEYASSAPTSAVDPLGLADRFINQSLSREFDLPEGYRGRIDIMPRPGGKTGGHAHIYDAQGREVAKVNERGGYAKTHAGKELKPPSELPPPVRNGIGRYIGRFFRAVGGVMDCLNAFIFQCPYCGGGVGINCRCGGMGGPRA
jgi:RHS repeat-associated protein